MTKVSFVLDDANTDDKHRMTPFNYLGVEIEGHTDTDVCLAISAVSQACMGALFNITNKKIDTNQDDEKGYLFFGLRKDSYITPSSNTVFDILYMACLQAKEKDPKAIEVELNVIDNAE